MRVQGLGFRVRFGEGMFAAKDSPLLLTDTLQHLQSRRQRHSNRVSKAVEHEQKPTVALLHPYDSSRTLIDMTML